MPRDFELQLVQDDGVRVPDFEDFAFAEGEAQTFFKSTAAYGCVDVVVWSSEPLAPYP